MAALTDMLCAYTEAEVAEALHPTTGLPSKSKFLPSLAEFRDALEAVGAAKQKVISHEQRIRQQLADRQPLPGTGTNKTYDELMAGLPPSLRKDGNRPKAPEITVEQFLAKHPHVSREEFDRIPNQPPAYLKAFGPNTSEKPKKAGEKPLYTGPIENIKPGDRLSWERMDEYKAYMKKTHGFEPKIFGFNEPWEDSGHRPFRIADKPKVADKQSNTSNPFED